MNSNYDLIERATALHYLPRPINNEIIFTTDAERDVWNKAIEESVSAIKRTPKSAFLPVIPTKFRTVYQGVILTYATCERCGQTLTYPTDNPFNCCPYCMARREEHA